MDYAIRIIINNVIVNDSTNVDVDVFKKGRIYFVAKLLSIFSILF